MKKLIFLLFLISTEAHAASGEGIPWFLVVPQVLNFSLFAIILTILLKDKVRNLFTQREQEYTQFFRKAEMERDEAEKNKLAIIQRLQHLEDDARVASQKAQSEAEELKRKIVSEARSLSERYTKEAERTAQNELERKIAELRKELLSGALGDAESLLKERVDVSMQKKLSGEFTKKIQVMQP